MAAALTVAADLVLTGALHLDGLADTADGVLPHLDRERRLAVMAAPEVGVFAIGVVGRRCSCGGAPSPPPMSTAGAGSSLLAGLWCGARVVHGRHVAAVPYARPAGGLATRLRRRSRRCGGAWRRASPVIGRGRSRPAPPV